MGRLVSAVTPSGLGVIEFEYDLVGNRESREYGPSGSRSCEDLHYTASTGLLESIDVGPCGFPPQSYITTPDEVGNLIQESGPAPQTYTFSPRNHLVSHNSGLQYSYDAYGRRVRSKRPVGGQLRTVRHYLLSDGRPYLDKPSALMQPAPVPWSYAYLGDRLLARFDSSGTIEHVVTDHIGYPMATISYTGTIQWQPDPEPFGDVYAEQSVGPGHDPLIRYPGQWRADPVLSTTEPAFTTLYYNTHRWYNPTWGRYTQSDPIGLDGGVNLFAYAENNPIAFRDPSGLSSLDPRCGYWTYKCLGPGWECWHDWYCYVETLSDEELMDLFNRASRTAGFEINSSSVFRLWFCFVSREACIKAFEYCGKIPLGIPSGIPRPRRR